MEKKPKYFSQIYDEGVKSGVIGEIGREAFLVLVALLPYMNNDGKCYPSEFAIAHHLKVSLRTAAKMVSRAQKAHYGDLPVIIAKQKKEKINGQWKYGNNEYIISQPIRERLINRFASVCENSHTEKNQENKEKETLPHVKLPHAGNLHTNDNHSENVILKSDNSKSLIKEKAFKDITIAEFENLVNNRDKFICLEIAKWLDEPSMNFILKYLSDSQCGMHGINWAHGRTKEDYNAGKVKNKRKYFNKLVRIYKEENSKK